MPDLSEGKIRRFDWFKFSIIFFVWFLGGWGVVNSINKVEQESVLHDVDNYYVMAKKSKNDVKLVKISLPNKNLVNSLEKMGVDVIVIENDYIIGQVLGIQIENLERKGFLTEPFYDADSLKKSVKIHIDNEDQIKKVEDMGFKIEKQEKNYISVNAISLKNIIKLKDNNFSVEVTPSEE